MEEKPHILVVDDDNRLRALLEKFLSDQGFMVTAAADAAEARRRLERFVFDLVVLDVMMPGESGIALLESLRREKSVPVLMLSAMGEAEDRIKGLECGAEDYLAKPFEPRELVLRIRAVLRRNDAAAGKARQLSFGDYRFDMSNGQLMCRNEVVHLTSGEAALLKALAAEAGRPLSRETLAAALPGNPTGRSVDVQVTRLRKKIGDSEEGKPIYLQTVRGAGYVLYAD